MSRWPDEIVSTRIVVVPVGRRWSYTVTAQVCTDHVQYVEYVDQGRARSKTRALSKALRSRDWYVAEFNRYRRERVEIVEVDHAS